MKKIKVFLLNLAKKNIVIRKLFRSIKNNTGHLKYFKYKIKYKVDDKMVFFEVYGGRNYTCSPKAIYERMLTMNEFKDYKFVWAFEDIKDHEVKKDKRLILVKSKSKEYYEYLSKSKYWIVNSIIDEGITKKKNQIYLQCWHGTPLKRLRYDIEVNGSSMNSVSEIRKRNDMDARKFDYFISPSKTCTLRFVSAFNLKKLGKEDIIIEEGYPRNDSLFNRSDKDIKAIKKKLGLPNDKKVIFYLPTFRDNQHDSSIGYTYKLEIDFDSLMKKFSKEYVILFRPHYFIANSIDLSKYKGFIYNVSKYDEINDLYLVSDIILTDYSSVFYDFANLKRPMMFYMYDLDLYKGKLRDFYTSLDELPGPISETQEELERDLKNIDKIFKENKEKYDKFNKKYNYLDDGDASLRVIKKVFKNEFKVSK